MSLTSRPHRHPRRPPLAALLALVAALALAAAGCGNDEGATTGDATGSSGDVASTTIDPGQGDPTIPELPENDDPSAVQCTAPPEGVFDATATVGGSLEEAEAAAAEQGCQIRVAIRDGKPLALTQDFRPDRVNVEVEDGEVVRIESIG